MRYVQIRTDEKKGYNNTLQVPNGLGDTNNSRQSFGTKAAYV